jgi:uncharacterized protein DUF4232
MCLAGPSVHSVGQTSQPSLPDCEPAALDVTLAFQNPPGEHVVAVHYRNISARMCVLNGGIGAMFDNWHEGHNIWAKECRNCDAAGTAQPVPPLSVAPGEGGYFLLRWRSVADGPEPCQDSDGFNTNGMVVVAPALLDHVCSVVDEQSFLPGFFGARQPDPGSAPDRGESAVAVELAAPDSVLFARDSFPFRIVIKDPKEQLVLDDRSCPVTFIRTRDETGNTMFHQISGFWPRCGIAATDAGRRIEMEMRAPGLGVLNVPGTSSIQFYVVAGPANAPEIEMAASNSLEMKIVDPAKIPPAWGPETAGIAVSLVLDKETYKTGEDIPLRINLENFRAAQEIGSGELPCDAGVTVDVRDASGTPVPEHGRGMLCTGHGWQTGYPVGKPVMVGELTLAGMSALPERPGTYTVTATWHANQFVHGESADLGRPVRPYATARSQTVTFRIVPERY